MNNKEDAPWHPYPVAPDVSAIRKKAGEDFGGVILTAVFGGGIDANPACGLYRNLLRLTIRSCEEYTAAIEAIHIAIEKRGPQHMIHAATHWEGCVEALHRAIQVAELFRRMLGKWVPGETHLRIEKEARFTDEETRPIRDLRDALQHLDERLAQYDPDASTDIKGAGFFIYSEEHGIAYHGIQLRYETIAGLLKRLGALCTWLHMQEIPAGHPLAHPRRKSSVGVTGAEAYRKPFTLAFVT
jgi:hypothetical protein